MSQLLIFQGIRPGHVGGVVLAEHSMKVLRTRYIRSIVLDTYYAPKGQCKGHYVDSVLYSLYSD